MFIFERLNRCYPSIHALPLGKVAVATSIEMSIFLRASMRTVACFQCQQDSFVRYCVCLTIITTVLRDFQAQHRHHHRRPGRVDTLILPTQRLQ